MLHLKQAGALQGQSGLGRKPRQELPPRAGQPVPRVVVNTERAHPALPGARQLRRVLDLDVEHVIDAYAIVLFARRQHVTAGDVADRR